MATQPIRRRDLRQAHTRRLRSRPVVVLASAIVLGLIIGSGYRLIDRPPTAEGSETTPGSQQAAPTPALPATLPAIKHPPCPSSVPVTLTSDPAMHLIAQAAADRLDVPRKELGGACVTLTVREQASDAAAADLSHPSTSIPRPDLWLASSPAWVALARSGAAGSLLHTDGEVLAQSPVVIAALSTSNLAALSGGWVSALGAATTTSADQRQLALVDPRSSTAGLLTLLGLTAQQSDSPSATTTAATTALARLSRRLVVPASDHQGLTDVIGGRLDAVSATEAEVLASAAAGSTLVAVTAGPGVPAAQFQMVQVDRPGSGTEKLAEHDARASASVASRVAARRLVIDWFRSSEARTLLPQAFLRDATGRAPTGTATTHLPTLQPTAAARNLSSGVVTSTLATWDGAGRRGRVLAVLDVSGSMAARVPGTKPAATRLQLAVAASRRALASFAPDSALGLWTFSTRLSGSKDYREVVPVGDLAAPLLGATRRETLDNALTAVQVRPQGDTGLYDTTLAAFRHMQSTYQQGRLNAVVLLTDGRNEDDRSVTQAQLLDRLRAEYDPSRPVHVITIGYGGGADLATLRAIAEATHGSASEAKDPRDIDRVLFAALGSL